MTRLYYVDPADTTAIAGPYIEGASITLPDGRRVDDVKSDASIDIYEAIEDNDFPDGRYYTSVRQTAFEGAVGSNDARVRETIVATLRDVDEVYDGKVDELNDYTLSVLTSNAQSTLAANWVISLDEVQTSWIGRVDSFLQDRMRDRVYDADPKDYWARDVPLVFFNKTTNKRLRQTVDEAQWGTTIKDIGLHSFDATDAQEACRADIDTAYNAGDAQAIFDIDVTEPTYGWPPVYDPEGGAGSVRGNGRR